MLASIDLVDSLQFTDWERKRKNRGEEFYAEIAESAEGAEKNEDKREEQKVCGVGS